MPQSEYEIKYRARFEDSGHAMAEVCKSLYLADINATEVHVDLSSEEKRFRRRLHTEYLEPDVEPARAA